MEQTQFLPGEEVPVAVRVSNHSGETLHFGKEDWLNFNVEGMNGFVVVKLDDPPMVHDFDVPTGKVATQHIDLAPYYTLTQPGQFKVWATVTLKAWDQEMTSLPKSFDVIKGVKLWEQDSGCRIQRTTAGRRKSGNMCCKRRPIWRTCGFTCGSRTKPGQGRSGCLDRPDGFVQRSETRLDRREQSAPALRVRRAAVQLRGGHPGRRHCSSGRL